MPQYKPLTRDQYNRLEEQYQRTPGPNEGDAASAEHYALVKILRELGYSSHSRADALEIAGGLLALTPRG